MSVMLHILIFIFRNPACTLGELHTFVNSEENPLFCISFDQASEICMFLFGIVPRGFWMDHYGNSTQEGRVCNTHFCAHNIGIFTFQCCPNLGDSPENDLKENPDMVNPIDYTTKVKELLIKSDDTLCIIRYILLFLFKNPVCDLTDLRNLTVLRNLPGIDVYGDAPLPGIHVYDDTPFLIDFDEVRAVY